MKQFITLSHRFLVACILLLSITFFPSYTFGQLAGSLQKMKAPEQLEQYGDAYLPANTNRVTSPGYRLDGSLFFTVQVNVDENGNNIEGDAANEPSMAIDPVNPDRMVIGWRQFDNVNSNFRQAGYGYTIDGGESWTFPGVIDAGIFRSDPVLGSDAQGNFYYNSLTFDGGNNYWCDVYRIEDGGTEWDNGVYAQGGDKQWMVIDQTAEMGAGNIYAAWNASFSICGPYNFTRSVNGGDSYEDCVSVTGEPYWGTLDYSDNGDLYVCGASWGSGGNFQVAKSTFAKDSTFTVFWNFSTTVDLDGYATTGGVNPGGLRGQAWVAVDRSTNETNGNVYLLCSVETYAGDPADVMFARSEDGGTTWSIPVRVNKDISSSNYQWFGTMSVAPNGRIDVVWLDTRNAPFGKYYSALYYSYSLDGGLNWSADEQLSDEFDPSVGYPNQDKMGDYFHMVSTDENAHLAWANTLNGEEDVYYGRITPWFVGIDKKFENEESALVLLNFPNPFKDITTIRYQLNERNHTQLSVYDLYGKLVNVLVNQGQEAGMYNTQFDASNLPEGVYYCKLTSGNHSVTSKLVVGK
jgi:hypothetical protein